MERKSVTNTAKFILELWNTAMFAIVWMRYYNHFTFDTYLAFGGLVTIFLFFTVYNMFCRLYKAFRIASSAVGETVFSQMISFGIADLILYVECCLIWNRYVNIVPGLIAVAAQLMGTALLVAGAKKYFMLHVPSKKTLVIYGEEVSKEETEGFCGRIRQKYAHLFDITEIESGAGAVGEDSEKIDECDTVLLYELSTGYRTGLFTYCMKMRKNLYFTPRLFDIVLQGCSPKHLLDTPLMKYNYVYDKRDGYVAKRVLDIVLSLSLLIVLSPLIVITAAAIKIEDRGPVFFKQKRCTKDAKVFEILKFRSMIVDAEKNGVVPTTVNDNRITRVGKVIRPTRIDELPQLFNILLGDMSFVGPRPERVEHVEQYTKEVPEFAYRMKVKGGLTGYAQIFGKYNTSAYDKLRLDLMYIEQQSLLLDLKMILLTIRTVFQLESTEGFSEEKSQKMNEKAKKEQKNGKANVKEERVLEQAAK